ncbi:MAG: arginine repressor [Dysgonomonas sp.]
MNKQARHKIIKETIDSVEVDSQDSLLNLLINKGIDVTQATLSRDIKEMKVVKMPTSSGNYAYQSPTLLSNDFVENPGRMSSFGFLSIEFSGHLAVIKTRPGYAMAIAGEIDMKAGKTILGTVAGDDTILIIPKEGITRDEILKSLKSLIPNI